MQAYSYTDILSKITQTRGNHGHQVSNQTQLRGTPDKRDKQTFLNQTNIILVYLPADDYVSQFFLGPLRWTICSLLEGLCHVMFLSRCNVQFNILRIVEYG